jgi:hypothetical protein
MEDLEPVYTGLTVDAYRREDQGAWEFAVNLDGARIVFAARKLGGIDSDIESARLAANQSQPGPTSPSQ